MVRHHLTAFFTPHAGPRAPSCLGVAVGAVVPPPSLPVAVVASELPSSIVSTVQC
jgi:hypothetical protein